MSPELEAALLGALVGSGLGVLGAYVFDVRKAVAARKEYQEREANARNDERIAVSTLLLEDLREAEGVFRQMYESERPTQHAVSRPAFYFDEVKASLRWFEPAHIQAIHEVFRLSGYYFESERLLRQAGNGHIASTPKREYEFRAQAGFILQAIPKAVDALVASGGVVADPAPTWKPVAFPQLPAVPTPAFEKTKAWLAAKGRSRDA